MYKIIVFLMLVLTICLLGINAESDFDVKVIYFKPSDAGDIDIDKHDRMLKDIQKHYQSEMTKHGYKDYTFPSELDDSGKLVIHVVNGKHNSKHYERNTASEMYHNLVKPELPFEFNNDKSIASRDNVHLIILSGVNAEPWGGKIGMGHTWLQGRWGGNALVLMDAIRAHPNHYLGLIAHELGHAFGLDPGHNGRQDALNGTIVHFGQTTADWGDKMKLLKFEADVLKSRPIFRKMNLDNEQVVVQEKRNKNPELVEDQELGENNMAIEVKPNFKLTTTWAELKLR